MKKLLRQFELRQEALDEQLNLYEEKWIESADRIVEMRRIVDGLRERLRAAGEDEAVRVILGEDGVRRVENEE